MDMACTGIKNQSLPEKKRLKSGLPETIRTSDTRLRRAVLYPAELQADRGNSLQKQRL